jgi:hypothetical protein
LGGARTFEDGTLQRLRTGRGVHIAREKKTKQNCFFLAEATGRAKETSRGALESHVSVLIEII